MPCTCLLKCLNESRNLHRLLSVSILVFGNRFKVMSRLFAGNENQKMYERKVPRYPGVFAVCFVSSLQDGKELFFGCCLNCTYRGWPKSMV